MWCLGTKLLSHCNIGWSMNKTSVDSVQCEALRFKYARLVFPSSKIVGWSVIRGCNELSKWGIVPLRGRLALLTCRALGTWRQLEHLCLIIEHEREKWKPIYKRALKSFCGPTWPYNGYHGCWNLTVTQASNVNKGKINTARNERSPFLKCFVSIWAFPKLL